MARFKTNRSPAQRISVKVIETGREQWGDAFAIYEDHNGRHAKLIDDLMDENGQILSSIFEKGLI